MHKYYCMATLPAQSSLCWAIECMVHLGHPSRHMAVITLNSQLTSLANHWLHTICHSIVALALGVLTHTTVLEGIMLSIGIVILHGSLIAT